MQLLISPSPEQEDFVISPAATLGFPGGSDGKASACSIGDPGSIPGMRRSPWRRAWQHTPIFLPGESNGQRSWRAAVAKSQT